MIKKTRKHHNITKPIAQHPAHTNYKIEKAEVKKEINKFYKPNKSLKPEYPNQCITQQTQTNA